MSVQLQIDCTQFLIRSWVFRYDGLTFQHLGIVRIECWVERLGCGVFVFVFVFVKAVAAPGEPWHQPAPAHRDVPRLSLLLSHLRALC